MWLVRKTPDTSFVISSDTPVSVASFTMAIDWSKITGTGLECHLLGFVSTYNTDVVITVDWCNPDLIFTPVITETFTITGAGAFHLTNTPITKPGAIYQMTFKYALSAPGAATTVVAPTFTCEVT